MTTQKLTHSIKLFRHPDLIVLQAVVDGTKPTALIENIFEKEVKESGLFYRHTASGNFIIANTKDKLDELMDLQNRFNKLHEELGIKLGFPLTAVQAFSKKIKPNSSNKIPIEYQGFFAFSEDHFAEEIKVIDSWYESAKKKFYAEMSGQ